MRFFYIPNCYSANIEGTGLSFRFRYTCFGIAPSVNFLDKPFIKLPKWYRLFLGFSFGFLYHSGQSNRWYIFNIKIGALRFWYLTVGESKNEYCGLHVSLNNSNGWRLIF